MGLQTNFQTIHFSENNEIATITLLDETSTMKMIKELTKACDYLEDESPCSVLVLQGSKTCFNRGLNFSEFQPEQPMDIHGFHKWEKLCVRLERLRKITISVLQGEVMGGGLQLALCTDLRIATPSVKLSLPEVKMGFLPGMAVFRLAKYIGLGHAKRMVLQGEVLRTEKAQELGVIDIITDDIPNALRASVQRFQPIHPITVQLARRLLNESFHDSFEDAIGHFLAAQQRAISQDCFSETIKKKQEK